MEYVESRVIRQIDAAAVRELGIPGLLLMENAARGACEVLHDCRPHGKIFIVCGPGNNGGDGLAIARLLAADGIVSQIYLVRGGKSLSSDAQSNLDFLRRSGIAVQEMDSESVQAAVAGLTSDDWIVDSLLGTGIRGKLQSPFYEIVEAINRSRAKVMSVDVPSGLDADTGEPCGVAVQADITVTFVATKSGFRSEQALSCLGRIEVRQIGVPQNWLSAFCENYET